MAKIRKLLKSVPWFVWLTALVCASAYVFYYKVYGTHVPEGWVWVGGVGGDDSVYLGLMRFVAEQPWGQIFKAVNPWHLASDSGSSLALLTPEFSSPYWFYFLGVMSKLLHLAPATLMILIRIILGFLFPLSVWFFLRSILFPVVGGSGGKGGLGKGKVAFLLYFFAFGLGGLTFLGFSLFKEHRFNLVPFWPFTAMGNALSYEMFEGTGLQPLGFLGRTYYMASLIFGLVSLVFLSKAVEVARRIRHRLSWGIWGGLALAFSQTIYPITGVGFVVLALVYLAVFKRDHIFAKLKPPIPQPARLGSLNLEGYSLAALTGFLGKISHHFGILAFFALGVLGGLPWFVSLLIDKTHFAAYAQYKVNATPLPLFVSTATLLLPSLWFVLKKGVRGVSAIRVAVTVLLLLLAVLLAVPVFPLRTVLTFGFGSGLTLVSYIYWRKEEKVALFFWLWFLFTFFASIMPIRDWTPFLPARFMLLMWLPLAVLAGLSLKKKVFLFIVLILGLPSVFFFSTWFLRKPLQPAVYALSKGDGGESLRPEYIKPEEFEALKFIENQPPGVVLGNLNLGMYLPLLSGRQSVLGREPMVFQFNEKMADYRRFFEAGTQAGEAGKIISKYNLSYVFFGPQERAFSNDIVAMKNFSDYLELAASFGEGKEEKVEVWRVR